VLQTDPLEHLKRLALLSCQRKAEHPHHERDVLKDREAGDEAEVLKDEPNAAPKRLHLRWLQQLQIAAEHLQLTLAGQVFPQQQAQQRRLPCPARAGQENELAFVDGKGQVAQRVNATTVELGKMIGLYQLVNKGYHASSARLSTSLTRLGLAFPAAAFIT